MAESKANDGPLMVTVSGCRGIVGRSLTPDVICQFVAAAASVFREQAMAAGTGRCVVVVARDGRRGGESVARIVSGALMACGCDVVDCGVVMTPTAGVMVQRLDAAGGLVATASHNPGEWNGLKPITSLGGAPAPADMRVVIERFEAGEPSWAESTRVGRVRADRSADDAHVGRVLDALARVADLEKIKERRFRVVLDSVNASGVVAGRTLLDRLGCDVVHINNADSGEFPHPPEPTASNLEDLCGSVRDAGADIGFAQDPDGDRLAVIDTDGTYIGEEYTLVLGAMSFLGALPPADAARQVLAANLSTSRMIDDVAASFGARVERTPVGEANVVRGMREAGSTLGGEGNGGIVWMDVVPIRDSLGAMALTLAMLARSGEPLGAAVERIPRYAIEKRKFEAEGVVLDAPVAESLCDGFPGAQVTTQDGVRLDFDAPSGDGRAWVHVRASNTEPIIRLIAEAPTQADAGAILDKAGSIVLAGAGG